MAQIDPNKKKQLDQNIKNMLANGASEEDVIKYSKDFHEKFSVKKKESSQSPSVQPKSVSVPKTGSSGTQEFEYKPVFDERGRQVKTKNEKGELVPYMEKVPKGFASSTEERKIVREEQKQKAQKSVKPTVKYQQYKTATAPKPEEIELISQDVDAELNQQGFWNGMVTGAKKGANFLSDVVMTIGTLGTETDGPELFNEQPFYKEAEEAKKQLVSENKGDMSKITPESIKQRTKDIVVQKRTEGLKIDKNNQFLSSLPEEEKKALNLEAVTKYKTLNDKDKYLATEASIQSNELENLQKDYAIVKAIIEKSNKNGTPLNEQFINKALELENNLKAKHEEVSALEKEYINNDKQIGSIEEEVDFLKRNYSTADKLKNDAKLGLADIYVKTTKGLPMLLSDLDEATLGQLRFGSEEGVMSEDERQQLIDEIIDWETAKNKTKSKFKKDVDFSNLSVDNFGSFLAQEVGTQIPVFAQMMLPGGVVSLGVTSAGDKYGQMETESNRISFKVNGKELQGFEKEDGSIVDETGFKYNPDEVEITSLRTPDYSKLQMATAAIGFGTAESLLGALPTKSALGRVAKSFEQSGKRQLIRDGIKSFISKPLQEAKQEAWTEGATSVVQNFIDIKVLGKNDVGLFDNVDHAMFTGGMLGGLMGSVPAIAGVAMRPFSSKTETKQVRKNLEMVLGLREQLNNQELTEATRKAISDKITALETENTQILTSVAEKSKGLSKEQYEAIVGIDKKQELLRLQATEIKADNSISNELKKQLLNDLKVEFSSLEDKRNILVSDKATILDTLPDSEKTKFRNEATQILKTEYKGEGEPKIEDEAVTKKAIQLYNQSKSNEAKVTESPVEEDVVATGFEKKESISQNKSENVLLSTRNTVSLWNEKNRKKLRSLATNETTLSKSEMQELSELRGKRDNYIGELEKQLQSISTRYRGTTNPKSFSRQDRQQWKLLQRELQMVNEEGASTKQKKYSQTELQREGVSSDGIKREIQDTSRYDNDKNKEGYDSRGVINNSAVPQDGKNKISKQGDEVERNSIASKNERNYSEKAIKNGDDSRGSDDYTDIETYRKTSLQGNISEEIGYEKSSKTNSSPDGNIRPTIGEVAEVGGIEEQTTENSTTESISPTANVGTSKTENEVEYVKKEIDRGILNWSGDISSPRIDLGISWSDIRKGEADIRKGNVNTVPAKRLIEAINKAKKEGGYRYKQGTGGASMRGQEFVTFEDIQRATNEDSLTDAEINEIIANQNELATEYDEYFNSLDEQTQNEILENYENQPREISEDSQRGESEINVSNEKETTAEPKQEVEKTVLERILNQDELKDIFDFLDSFKIDPNDLKATLPFLPEVWNAFIEAVKLSLKAGKTMRNAINEAKKILETQGFDKNEIGKVVSAFEEKVNQPNQTFERKQGKKTLLSRMDEGKDAEVKKAIKDYSLDYEVENQEIAQRNAELFVEKVGVRSALKSVRSGEIVGAEKAFVYAKIIDVISNEIASVPESEVQELEDMNVKILEEIAVEFDKESRNAGRFISALQKVYSSSKGRYNLTKQVQSYRARHDGNIPDEILQKFIEADAKIKEYEKRIEELEAEKKKQEEERAFENIVESIARKNKIDKSKGITNKAKAKAFADKLRSYKSTNKGTLSAATPMSLAVDLAIETAATTMEVTGSIVDAIQKGLETIRNSKLSTDEQAEAVQQFLNVFDVEEGASENIKIDGEGRLKIPHSLIREKVEQGIDNIEDLVDAIYDEVSEMYPDEELTKRDVRDAITQYGKIVNQTKDEIEIQISQMKSLGKLLSGIEDALTGKRPLRSGLQRRPFTLEEREQKRKLRELLRDLPMDDADVSKAWKTALDTIKSRLQNEIQDLDEQIAKGEKRKSEKKQIEYDEEVKGLKELRDKKREILDELVGKPELTEEQKIEKAMILVQKKIDELQKNIVDGNIAYKTRPTPVTSAKLEALKKQREELYAEIEKMRKESGLAEKKRLDLAKRSRIRRIEELKSKIENRDFSKREQKPLPVDAELLEIESKLQEQKAIYEKEKYIDELKNRSPFRKFVSTFVDFVGITRVLKAGGEFSQVLVQQGFLTPQMLVTNPKAFFTAMARLGKAFASPDTAKRYEDEMKASPLYPLMQKTKLSLTGTDHKLDAQEENYQLDMVTDIWNIIGDKLDRITGETEILTLTGLFKKAFGKELTESDKKTLGTQFKEASFWKMFERAAVTYSNYIKMVKFEQGVRELQKDLKDPINDIEDYKKVANYINVFSGRASLGKAEFISKDAALIFFSLRNAYSQFQQLNPFYYLVTLGDARQFKEIQSGKDLKNIRPTVAQKMAVKSFMTSVIAITGFKLSFLVIANAGADDEEDKWKLESDPRSSDFGKLRKGKTTFDMWHGLNGLFVMYSRIFLQQTKSTKSGEIKDLGKGFGTPTTSELLTRYVTNKFAPTAGYMWRLGNTHEEIGADGKKYRVDQYGNVYGEKEMLDLFIPIYYGSVYEIAKEDPDTYQAFLTSLGILGMSVGTDPDGEKFKKAASEGFSLPKLPSPPKPPTPNY